MADLTDATVVTQGYLNSMKAAGESVQKLSTIQNAAFEAVTEGGNKLAESYNKLGDSLHNQMAQLESNHKTVTNQLGSVGQNLSSINSAYEMQLNGLTAQIKATESLNTHIGAINDQMGASVEGAKLYKDQIAQLSKSVSELNTIYGNMLSAMSVGGGK